MLKKLFAILLVLASIFILAGCGSTTSSTEEETKTLEDEIVGTWEAEKDNTTETYTFAKDGTFDVEVVSDDKTTSSASGNYSIEDDELTLETTNLEGQVDENTTTDDENPSSDVDNEELGISGEPYVCKITIDGDKLTMDGGNTGTYVYTRVDEK